MSHDNAEIDVYPIHPVSSVAEAVQVLNQDSWALYQVDRATALAMDRATTAVLAFFHSNDDKLQFQKIVNGHLHGYNEPSSAKVLFRAFCGSSRQPWPNADWKEASIVLANKIHDLLVQCFREINRLPPVTHRGKPSKERTLSRFPVDDEYAELAVPATETAQCPLDFFLYHGHDGNNGDINCSEHVDRGLLVAVCLSKVPGLEVLSRQAETFVCPEEMLLSSHTVSTKQSLSRTMSTSSHQHHEIPRYLCLMVGDQLKGIRPDMPACVHRVRNNLLGERLSITYELRV